MAKLADLRANLSIEEREEYEKYKNTKIKDDDIKIMDEKDGAGSSTSRNGMQGCFFQIVKLVHTCSDKSKIVQFIRNWSNFILKYDFFGWSCFVKQIFIPFWYLGFWLILAMKLRNYYSLFTFFTAQGKTGKTEI